MHSQIHILGTFLVYILHKALCLSVQIPVHIHVYMFNSESTRLEASMEFVASRRVCLRPDIWDLRTEAEVERIEARTRIKAGAPVCSDGAYCVRPQIRRRMGPSGSVRSGPQQ